MKVAFTLNSKRIIKNNIAIETKIRPKSISGLSVRKIPKSNIEPLIMVIIKINNLGNLWTSTNPLDLEYIIIFLQFEPLG